jgi:L-malate glycosyltransferase
VPRSVLFVSHTARISGAERTLLDLLPALPEDVRPVVACPPGPLRDELATAGVHVVSLRGTDASLKLHPIGTPRALSQFLADGITVRRAARRHRASVVHANSTRAGLACALPRLVGGPALAVHVHDVLGPDRVSQTVGRVIDATADVVLANSRHVAERLGTRRAEVVVVDNPVDLARFDPGGADGTRIRDELGVAADEPVLIVVGQLTPWKGQDTAIRALAALRDRAPSCRLLVVGEPVFASAGTRFDNLAYVDGLHRLVRELGVEDRVSFLGARSDVPDLLAAAHVALVPSWEEPFGRVAIEAMAMGVPVIATERGGPADILSDGGGILVPPHGPQPWAAAIAHLLEASEERARMGAIGRRRAVERYGLEDFTARTLDGWAVAQRARGSRLGDGPGPQLRAQRHEPDADGKPEHDAEDDVAAGLGLLR